MNNCRGTRRSCPRACASLVTVTYDPNGGAGGLVDTGIQAYTAYTIKTAVETGGSLPGATLSSWNTQPGGGGVTYTPGQVINVMRNLTLYAQWVPFF